MTERPMEVARTRVDHIEEGPVNRGS